MIGRELENCIDDFVGFHATVKSSSNALQVGMEGTVVDETKNMIIMKTGNGLKKIQKKGLVVDIFTTRGRSTVDMSVLTFRSEDRIKNYRKIARRIRKNHESRNRRSGKESVRTV